MSMVIDADHFALEDGLQIFQIDDETGYGIDFAGDGDFEGVVVAVSVAVRAFAEDALVLFLRPCVVPVIVGGGEFGFAGKQDHRLNVSVLMIDAGPLGWIQRLREAYSRPFQATRLVTV